MLWLRQVTYASEAADHCHPELASTQTWSRLIDELRTLWATCNARYFACQPHLLSSQPHLPELWLGAGWDALLNKFGSFSLLCFWTYLLAEWLNRQGEIGGIHSKGTWNSPSELRLEGMLRKSGIQTLSPSPGLKGLEFSLLHCVCLSAKVHPQFWHSIFVIFHKSL